MEPTQPGIDQPVINIVGDKVALGPHRRELLPFYLKWINDFEVTRTLGAAIRPMTLEAEEVWYERASRGEVGFTIYERSLQPLRHDRTPGSE